MQKLFHNRMEVKSLSQSIRCWARLGRFSTKNSLVVEKPSGSEGEVGEEAIHTQGKVLLQLRIGILDPILYLRAVPSSTLSPGHFPKKVSSTHSWMWSNEPSSRVDAPENEFSAYSPFTECRSTFWMKSVGCSPHLLLPRPSESGRPGMTRPPLSTPTPEPGGYMNRLCCHKNWCYPPSADSHFCYVVSK